MKYEPHEYAAMFPLADEQELRDMADDIKQRGLLCKIVLLDKKILDGRNRFQACQIAGVEPRFTKYAGTDPLADVISWNLHRRHLSTSQRAALAVELKPMFETQARERQLATLKHGDANPVKANLPERASGQSRDQAAAAVGVSGRTVQDAELIKHAAPDVFDEIKKGKKTVNQAKKEVHQKRRDPLDMTKDVADEDSEEKEQSSTLFHLKRYWRKANKADKKTFREWIKQ